METVGVDDAGDEGVVERTEPDEFGVFKLYRC